MDHSFNNCSLADSKYSQACNVEVYH